MLRPLIVAVKKRTLPPQREESAESGHNRAQLAEVLR